MDVIVLAGGLGTRLKSVVNDLPKPMAPVKNKPFLEYVLKWISEYPIDNIVLSTGYKSEKIEEYFKNEYNKIPIKYAREDKPLGTGGGIFNALKYTQGENVIIVNGDTYFPIDLNSFFAMHLKGKANISIALKEMENFDRYGSVSINKKGNILRFHEKRPQLHGLINGGIYVLNKRIIDIYNLPLSFSFETEILEKEMNVNLIKGFVFNTPFLDIGLPEDYSRAADIL
jgi:D-glycero-alpha-D-manno-heptose 1-phosphate guanylyltransferase